MPLTLSRLESQSGCETRNQSGIEGRKRLENRIKYKLRVQTNDQE